MGTGLRRRLKAKQENIFSSAPTSLPLHPNNSLMNSISKSFFFRRIETPLSGSPESSLLDPPASIQRKEERIYPRVSRDYAGQHQQLQLQL
jgi:hypothetical protein